MAGTRSLSAALLGPRSARPRPTPCPTRLPYWERRAGAQPAHKSGQLELFQLC